MASRKEPDHLCADGALPVLTDRRARAWATRRAKYGPAGHSGTYSRPGRRSVLEIVIDLIGGYCPVQAEGSVNGEPFYFRARGQRWTMGIGGDVVGNPTWFYEQPYGDDRFAAGWMEIAEARSFIAEAAGRWLSDGAAMRPPVIEGENSRDEPIPSQNLPTGRDGEQ